MDNVNIQVSIISGWGFIIATYNMCIESKKSKTLKLTAAEASLLPVEERKCISEEETENQMDTSLEEPEVAEGSPGMADTCTSVFQEGETNVEPIPESGELDVYTVDCFCRILQVL